ncbi:MAG TPA: hypothetical protein VIM77_13815 [Mucilaginibacter sp.]
MKNKRVLYFLVPAVVLIWGLIFYRIFAAMSGNEDAALPATAQVKEIYNDYGAPADTTRLQLNYRDPFSMAMQADTVKRPVEKLKVKPLAVIINRPAMNWDFVRYSGYIRNPDSKKLIALLHINGKEVLLNEGETAEKVKLIRNLKDSVKILYEGKTKFLPIKPGS